LSPKVSFREIIGGPDVAREESSCLNTICENRNIEFTGCGDYWILGRQDGITKQRNEDKVLTFFIHLIIAKGRNFNLNVSNGMN